MPSVYEAAGGEEGLLRLARAWHARVVDDEVVGHAFRHGFHPDHTTRLAAYWAEAMTDIALSESDPVRHALQEYFEWATHASMARYQRSADDVPEGLNLPHWSWDGLVR
jgi:hemoglobin